MLQAFRFWDDDDAAEGMAWEKRRAGEGPPTHIGGCGRGEAQAGGATRARPAGSDRSGVALLPACRDYLIALKKRWGGGRGAAAIARLGGLQVALGVFHRGRRDGGMLASSFGFSELWARPENVLQVATSESDGSDGRPLQFETIPTMH